MTSYERDWKDVNAQPNQKPMSDYKQRFRERFWLHRVPRNTKQMADILAFIEEVGTEKYAQGFVQGRFDERMELIAHVESLAHTYKPCVEEYCETNETIDLVLNFLREPEKKVEVKTHLTDGKVTKVAVNGVELLPNEYHVKDGAVFLSPPEPDASQGCCPRCKFKGGVPRLGVQHCGNFDCPCHSKRKCCELTDHDITWAGDGYFCRVCMIQFQPRHSPQGDNQTN